MTPATEHEQQIIGLCLAALQALPGSRVAYVAEEPQARIHLSGPWGSCLYRPHILTRLTPLAAELMIRQSPATDEEPALLLTDYVSPPLAERLRAAGVQYLDTSGNAFLRQGALLVEVGGRKRLSRAARTSRGFQPSGLRLIHLILKKPESLNWTHRQLAQTAGVALGSVGAVLRELRARGFSAEGEDGRQRLLRRAELYQRWQIGYLERLRPKLHIETCRLAAELSVAELPELIRQQGLQAQVQLGGELGAALVLDGVSPRGAVLHVSGDPLALMLRLRLVPDAEGAIQVQQALVALTGTAEELARQAVVDPLVLHAELGEGDAVAAELAQRLFERYLARHLNPAQTAPDTKESP